MPKGDERAGRGQKVTQSINEVKDFGAVIKK